MYYLFREHRPVTFVVAVCKGLSLPLRRKDIAAFLTACRKAAEADLPFPHNVPYRLEGPTDRLPASRNCEHPRSLPCGPQGSLLSLLPSSTPN